MGKQTEAKPKKTIKAYQYFAKDGDGLKRLKKSCPKCGPGYFMGQHKGRSVCGRCSYAEFDTKPKADDKPKADEKKAEAKKSE